MGMHNPSDNASATQYGTLQSDGATYEIWQKERIDAPSILGDHTDFQQYWSIRTKMHCGGIINVGNHFDAWTAAGLQLGTQNYMAMVIEGQVGSGSADITAGVAPTRPVPETTTNTQRTETHRPTSTSSATTTSKLTITIEARTTLTFAS
jgi:endo-1,4-beta-xylanase